MIFYDLFKEQVSKHPNKIALKFEKTSITYYQLKELVIKNEQLLKNMDVSGTILLSASNSVAFFAMMLACNKAGIVYVLVPEDMPEEKIKMLHDKTGAHIRISFESGKEVFTECSCESNIKLPEKTFMIIPTSGSTGVPKLICKREDVFFVTMNSVLNRLNHNRIYGNFCSLHYAFGFTGVVCTLISGGTIVLAEPTRINDYRYFVDFINDNNIEIVRCPTAILNMLSCHEEAYKDINSCNIHIIAGGEKMSVTEDFCNYILACGIRVYSDYGSTETCNLFLGELKGFDQQNIFNVDEIYYPNIAVVEELDAQNRGHLFLKIEKKHIGFFDLTSNKYIFNKKMDDDYIYYDKNDFIQMIDDKSFYIISRIDNVYKLRGQRISFEEIEQTICKYEAVSEALVFVNKNQFGHDNLIAFVSTNREITPNDIYSFLTPMLNQYMIPLVVLVDSIPRNSHGKKDRIIASEIYKEIEFTAENILDIIRHKIVFDIDYASDISKESLVNLGVDSLTTVSLIVELEEEYGVDLMSEMVVTGYNTIDDIVNIILGKMKGSQ